MIRNGESDEIPINQCMKRMVAQIRIAQVMGEFYAQLKILLVGKFRPDG